jgi:hypothetical protein
MPDPDGPTGARSWLPFKSRGGEESGSRLGVDMQLVDDGEARVPTSPWRHVVLAARWARDVHGGFKRSSQHLDSEELRWEQVGVDDGLIVLDVL